MFSIPPIGERSGAVPLYGVTSVSAVAPPVLPGVAVAVSPLGQLLGTLAQAQKRLGELAAPNSNADPSADRIQLGIAAGELVEAFNLSRSLPLPGQATLPARLTAAFNSQQQALAQAGIALTGEGRLEIDSGRLLSAFDTNRQATLAALAQAAVGFADAGTVRAPVQQEAPPAPVARQETAAPPAPAQQRPVEPSAEEHASAAAVVAETATRRAQAVVAERLATEQAAQLRRQEAARADTAQADARRLADLQTSATLAEASQAALTREARQAAYRLEVAREVANVQIAVQDDIATQDQRLAEVRAAALRQLSSSAQEDLSAQALADRLARERDATATAALTDSQQLAQARLLAARQDAAVELPVPGEPPQPLDRLAGLDDTMHMLGPATLAGLDDVLDEAVAPGNAAASRAVAAANIPAPPNAADPAIAAAIAAQRLAGGAPGGPPVNNAAPSRTQLIAPVQPVGKVTAAEGSRTRARSS